LVHHGPSDPPPEDLTGSFLTAEGFRRGMATIDGQGTWSSFSDRGEPTGDETRLILPPFVNSHVHLGDAAFHGQVHEGSLEELFRPPDGLKHRLLRETDRGTLVSGIRRALGDAWDSGTGILLDFREGGCDGVSIALEAREGLEPARTPAHIIMGRPDHSIHTTPDGGTENDLHGMSDDLEGLKGDLHGMTDDLEGLKGDLHGMTDDLEGLKGDLHGMTDDLEELKGDLHGMTDDLEGLKVELEGIRGCTRWLGLPSADAYSEEQRRIIASFAREHDMLVGVHAFEEGKEPLRDLEDLDPGLMIHLSHGGTSEWEWAASRGTAVTVCPRSNQRFSRPADLEAALTSGAIIMVGTDNAMIQDQDMVEELRLLHHMGIEQGVEPPGWPERLLLMATHIPMRWLRGRLHGSEGAREVLESWTDRGPAPGASAHYIVIDLDEPAGDDPGRALFL